MKIKQIFKGQLLTRTKVKNNILKIWDQTTDDERYEWYKAANEFAQTLTPFIEGENKLNKSVGIIAATSPMKRWETNQRCAEAFVKTGKSNHTKMFQKKCEDILATSGLEQEILNVLNGRKIQAFYHNIRHYESGEFVTIDRHAVSIALGKWISKTVYAGITAIQYQFFQDCYKHTASSIGVTPLLLQSATWVRFRQIRTQFDRI
jgi:hypothetical protein